MKLHKSKKDPELYYYFNAKKEKRWMYRHKYYDSLGKRREKYKRGFVRENEAYRALLEVKANTINGRTKQVENSNLTVAEWLDIWYETYKNDWEITTRIQRENAIKYQMKPLLGKYVLVELEKTTYKRVYINKLLKTYKPSTVALFHRLFKIAINAAVDDDILPRNRFNKITIENHKKETNFLTAKELNVFLSAAKKLENITNFTLIFLLAYTGLRKGEALGLKWKNVNFKEKTLTVERTRDNKGVRSPKTKRSERTIYIDDVIISNLKEYRKWCKKTKFSFGLHLKDDDFIFISHQNGNPITENVLLYCFRRIFKEAKNITQITPHGLRHTHATILISKKVPVNEIADRLGNTPQMIHDVYGHTFKDLKKESVMAFSQSLEEAGGGFGGGF